MSQHYQPLIFISYINEEGKDRGDVFCYDEDSGQALLNQNGTSAYGIAANEKTNLEDKGFSVKSTANAPSDVSGFDGVKLFKLTNDKVKTATALKERYDADFEKDLPDSLASYECDFIVVISNGYKAK